MLVPSGRAISIPHLAARRKTRRYRGTAAAGTPSARDRAARAGAGRGQGDLEQAGEDRVRVRPTLVGQDRDADALGGQPAEDGASPEIAAGVTQGRETVDGDRLDAEPVADGG